jgi:hypothetical protein
MDRRREDSAMKSDIDITSGDGAVSGFARSRSCAGIASMALACAVVFFLPSPGLWARKWAS